MGVTSSFSSATPGMDLQHCKRLRRAKPALPELNTTQIDQTQRVAVNLGHLNEFAKNKSGQ